MLTAQLDREAQPLVGEGRGHPDIDHRDVGHRAADRAAERLWVPDGVGDVEASAASSCASPSRRMAESSAIATRIVSDI